jgi:hypothetical protein
VDGGEENARTGSPFYRHGDVFYARGEELEREEFMRGEARGRLAVALDVLTDAMVLAGIGGAKELVASALNTLNDEADARRGTGGK